MSADVKQLCDRCHEAFWLLARTVKGWLCAVCWRLAGEPRAAPVPAAVGAAHLLDARKRMLKRGGEDRYRVLAGRT